MIRRSRSRSSQSSSIHPPPQPIEVPSETQSQPTPTEVGGIGSISNSNIGRKRTRGSNRGIKLFNRQPDDKLIVQFNAEGQPIGENARPFTTLCGIIVRTPGNAPLQVMKWADVPEQAKDKMWKHIQDHAVVDDERKKWVLQNEERLQHLPPDVSREDWAWLVQYWGNPEVQVVASKNKANCSKQTLKHTGGTKSFARHRDEETRSRIDGSIPSRADIFIRTHSRKDGTPVDERSAEIISKFKELSATQEGGSSSSIGDQIYTQVMGEERHGRVRGYGLGPTPTSVFGSTSRQPHAAFDEVVGELSSVHQKLQQMEEWKKNQEEEMRLLHAIIADMRQQLSAQGQDPSEGAVVVAKNAAKGIAETQNVGSDVEPMKEGEEVEKSVDGEEVETDEDKRRKSALDKLEKTSDDSMFGEQLASGADGGDLVIWKMHPTDDGRTWKVLKTLSFHRKDVIDLQWSTDGAFLVSGSVDNSCIIWDASKGSVHQTFDSHLHYVQGVAWDSLGQYLASISSNRTCRIYLNKPTGTAQGIKKMHYVCQNVLSKFEQQIVDDSKLTKSHLFHDETLPSFFRRFAWSPDGSFLLVPAGTVLN
ncbi:hypothetical protein MRB53_023625 [Persea americana]|uniref:Uncharacterized protein n=1 Tax=Persea americana TaxID=3435 RepID=A0ACC2LB15_PERAE|nr:hypothetical protein MRB53_023625 [Persea americana]